LKIFIVNDEYENCRLDKWFRKNIIYLSQGVIERLLRNGRVKLNGNKAKSNIRLQINDIIEVQDDFTSSNKLKEIDFSYIKLVQDNIIFENEDILAINKVNNLAVQGGSKIQVSIDDILPYLDSENELRLVHRLDKDTTGILLIAKNNKAAQLLGKAFQEGSLEKKYWAILTNIPKQNQGVIKNFVKKANINGQERMVLSEEGDGDLAITKYKVLQILKEEYCLVEFSPFTGRTHQLRLHAEGLNCSILGDRKYGKNSPKNFEAKYLYLHAKSINLGSLFGKKIQIQAPLFNYFTEMIESLNIK
jgi:23S rRNA pseudouridine955/2504/2580 synthase